MDRNAKAITKSLWAKPETVVEILVLFFSCYQSDYTISVLFVFHLQFMLLLILRHTLPILLSGTNEYSFPLFLVRLFDLASECIIYQTLYFQTINLIVLASDSWNYPANICHRESSGCPLSPPTATGEASLDSAIISSVTVSMFRWK